MLVSKFDKQTNFSVATKSLKQLSENLRPKKREKRLEIFLKSLTNIFSFRTSAFVKFLRRGLNIVSFGLPSNHFIFWLIKLFLFYRH